MRAWVRTKKAFNVIGRLGQGPARFGPVWIRPLWKDLEDEFDSIVHLTRRGPDGEIPGMWGLMSDAREYLAPWGEEGRYLAGCEANPGASPPKGWTLWSIPEQTYLVVACKKTLYTETYERVMREMISGGAYRLAGAVHEFYPPERADEMEIYVPFVAVNE